MTTQDVFCQNSQYQVSCATPFNIGCENPGWIDQLLNDPALWKSIDDDAFPEPISHELLRLRSIFEQRQVFAMVFQIKDVGEVLMKFPILCSAAYLKNDVITKKLIEKPLSLGDWQGIASELLKHSQHQYVYTLPDSLRTILVDILRMYQKSLFVNQRNRFIGHGALGFDDNAEYRHYCENMLSAIAKHLDRVKEAYRHLMLSIDENNNISVTIDGESIALSPFIVRLGEELCFFDYLDGRKQPPPAYGLDYISGGAHRRFEAPYLADVYAQLGCKFDADFVVENSVSDLEAENVLASMNEASNFVAPTALTNWVEDNVVHEYMGGVHLLIMDRGMGKTAFAYALESGVIKLDDVKVCAYYCSHAQMRGVGNFVQGVMNALNGSLVETVYKALPRLLPDSENKAENMLEVLQGYKAAYTRRGEGSKLLLILDGLDEIPADQAKVFEYIPKSEDMPENIYILLTARNPKREQIAPHVVEALNKLSIGSHYEVVPDSPENQATLHTYLSQQDMVKTERGYCRPTDAEIDRLLELSGNTFINLTVYSKLVSAGYAVDALPELNNEQLFSYYLSVIRAAYGEKLYNEALRVLLLIATAYENLTLQELAYLCGYPGITLQLLAFVKDFGALIMAVRSNVRGTELAIANERYREYVESVFSDELRQMTVELVDRILAEDVYAYKSKQGMECIPDGVLYLAAYILEYIVSYADKTLNSKEIHEELWNRIKDIGLTVLGVQGYRLDRVSACYTGVIQLLEDVGEENDLAMGYMNRAIAYCSLVRYTEALADNNRAVDLSECLHRDGRLPDENNLAMVYMSRATTYQFLTRYAEALADNNRAVEIRERLYQHGGLSDENDLAKAYMNRAISYHFLTNHAQALIDYSRTIDIRERLYQEGRLLDENALAMVYMNRAVTFDCLIRKSEALKDYSRVVEIRERLYREGRLYNENYLATAYMNRAITYHSLVCYNKALADYTRAVEIRERLYREDKLPDESDLAMVYTNRANLFHTLARYNEALADNSHAVEIAEKMFQKNTLPDEIKLAAVYMNRAITYQYLLRYTESLIDCSCAVEILERLKQENRLPDENDLAMVYVNRADIYRSLNSYSKALTDDSRALGIRERLYRENRLLDKNDLAIVYTSRACSYHSLTRYAEALTDYNRSIEIMEHSYREGRLPDENALAKVYMNRAITYRSLTRYKDALADYARAIEIREHLHREGKLPDENDLATSYMNRANTYDFLARYEDALADITRAVSICERLHREGRLPDENDLAKVYMSRANTYDSLVRYEDALADITRAVSICERLHREGKLPDENYLAAVYMNRANTYRSLTRYEDALADYARAIEIWERLHREGRLYDINDLLRCYLNKAIYHGKLGDPDKEVAEYTKGITLCEELPADKLPSVMPTLIKLYKYRAITHRDDLHESEKVEADFARVRQLEEQNKFNS